MLNLMIIDDEPIILAGIRDMVEQEKTPFTRISVAFDGVEALEQMAYFRPDLVITDIHMPEMDGLAFIREAHKKNVRRFIILTGHDKFEYAREALRLKVVEYLLKPINQSELSSLLKSMATDIVTDKNKERDEEADKGPAWYSNEKMRMLADYVHANYGRDISIADAATWLNLNPAYAGQLFKKETGKSFISYLRCVRMEKAKALLLDMREMSMDHIACCVGYENSRTFYKVFREHVGQTPGEYRDSNGKNGES
ncbi:two-component system response regulator YesN [Paenibacillus rhizosphaerae]|uniref:Two-component system response regulator YesN n=1 Tax=Paenibacillus rhizosphaerae TaxID=297318 RepID=A0A839TJA7_9BACL|nr:response regulator [Paenibacillus rhizosphaerae]MBB3125429.1 two-component system response regulator YesN [Paenibacillus rhizosphaerae]